MSHQQTRTLKLTEPFKESLQDLAQIAQDLEGFLKQIKHWIFNSLGFLESEFLESEFNSLDKSLNVFFKGELQKKIEKFKKDIKDQAAEDDNLV